MDKISMEEAVKAVASEYGLTTDAQDDGVRMLSGSGEDVVVNVRFMGDDEAEIDFGPGELRVNDETLVGELRAIVGDLVGKPAAS